MGTITINNAALDAFPTVNAINSTMFKPAGFGGDIVLNVQFGDTLAVAIISAYTALGTTTVTDSAGATWTKYGIGPNRQEVWYTSDLATIGNRTISCTADGTFYGIISAFTVINSGGTLAGTNTAAVEAANVTISSAYSITGNGKIVSVFFSSRGGEVGPTTDLIPGSYGTGQIVLNTYGIDGIAGPPDLRVVITRENKFAGAEVDTQSFTNPVSNDNKDILCFSILKL